MMSQYCSILFLFFAVLFIYCTQLLLLMSVLDCSLCSLVNRSENNSETYDRTNIFFYIVYHSLLLLIFPYFVVIFTDQPKTAIEKHYIENYIHLHHPFHSPFISSSLDHFLVLSFQYIDKQADQKTEETCHEKIYQTRSWKLTKSRQKGQTIDA